MSAIGFNSGCLRKLNFTLEDSLRLIANVGGNAIELSFRRTKSLLDFNVSSQLKELIKSYSHVSIHAPFDPIEDVRYGNNEISQKIISKLKEISSILPIAGVVIHPSQVDDFEFLHDQDLPFLFENMDLRKKAFKDEKDFVDLIDKYPRFGFVLDLEHAFENDQSLELARRFIKIMGGKLKEIHISGAVECGDKISKDKKNHCLLMNSQYNMKIIGLLKEIPHIPIILEISVESNPQETLKNELKLIKNPNRSRAPGHSLTSDGKVTEAELRGMKPI